MNGRSSADDDYMGPPESEESLRLFRQIRQQLAADRDDGLGFSEAWRRAFASAPTEIRGTLYDTRGAWRAAYDGRPAPREAVAAALLEAGFGAEDDRRPDRVGVS